LVMLITIGVILVAVIASAALEIWLFWRLGELSSRRSTRSVQLGRNAHSGVATAQRT
jgi:hypothetical protein